MWFSDMWTRNENDKERNYNPWQMQFPRIQTHESHNMSLQFSGKFTDFNRITEIYTSSTDETLQKIKKPLKPGEPDEVDK